MMAEAVHLARRGGARCSSSTRSTASTAHSRTLSCLTSSAGDRAGRGDHREPLLRAQRGFALALPRRGPGAARRRRGGDPCRALGDAERGLGGEGVDASPEALAASPSSPRAMRGGRSTCSSPPSRTPAAAPWPRRRSGGAGRPAQGAGLRQGRRGALQRDLRPAQSLRESDPKPRCTGSPACSRPARIPSTSPAGWSASPARTLASPIPEPCAGSRRLGCLPSVGTAGGAVGARPGHVYLALAPKSIAVYRAQRRCGSRRGAPGRAGAARHPQRPYPPDVGAWLRPGYVYAPDTDEGVGGLECLPERLMAPASMSPLWASRRSCGGGWSGSRSYARSCAGAGKAGRPAGVGGPWRRRPGYK